MARELTPPARPGHVPEPVLPEVPGTEPVRTCVGCRARATKSELLRVVAGSDAQGSPALVPDPGATAPGRGAHLHPVAECFDLAVRRKAFPRALRAGGALSAEPLRAFLDSLEQDQQAAVPAASRTVDMTDV